MRHILLLISFVFFSTLLSAQKEFHVFPENYNKTPGLKNGDGSFQNPWDLQTALYQKNTVVNGGDIIWLHEGVYSGKFISTLNSSIAGKHITVSSFPNEWAVLNGNVSSKNNSVLIVKGANVIYKDFEVTWLGDFSRYEADKEFFRGDGINHNSGVNCKFINLEIHDNPGSGFGSWRETGGTTIENCFIYNNGFMTRKRGSGVGMYIQNMSLKFKIIKNNTIFNNYYKGIEVWSANKNAKEEYVKNIILENNVIFNSGLASGGRAVDNIIVATDDRSGVNIAKNIYIKNNILYHNTDFLNNQVGGDAASLTIGYNKNAPVENVEVDKNIIIGRNNALRLLHAKSIKFTNNVAYTGYVFFTESFLEYFKSSLWNFNNNSYFTKRESAFRINNEENYPIKDWINNYKIDSKSTRQHIKSFNMINVLNISKNENKPNSYRVVLFNKQGKDVLVDFSKYSISKNSNYKIFDVENKRAVLKSGNLGNDGNILVPMNSLAFEKPSHNTKAQKTLNNFGVYIIEFDESPLKKRKSFFSRLFGKLF